MAQRRQSVPSLVLPTQLVQSRPIFLGRTVGEFKEEVPMGPEQREKMMICSQIIDKLRLDQVTGYGPFPLFQFPVNPIKDLCPDYLTKIKKPMDFATIQVYKKHGFSTQNGPKKYIHTKSCKFLP